MRQGGWMPRLPCASIMLSLMVLVVLPYGSQASRYCSYHPEAPECAEYLRDKPLYRHHYRDPNWERETYVKEDDTEEIERREEASISAISAHPTATAIIDSTSVVITSSEGAGREATTAPLVPPPEPLTSAASIPPKDNESQGEPAPQEQEITAWWLLLLVLVKGRKVFEAVAIVAVSLIASAGLAWMWARRLARQINAMDDIAAVEALLARGGHSPFAALADILGSSFVVDNRKRLETKLADLHRRRQHALKTEAADVASRLSVANRKREFAQRWRRVHCKTLSIDQLEAFLAEAQQVGSEWEKVIREWLEFRRHIEQETNTPRLTMGEDGGSLSASLLIRSGELRVLTAAQSTDNNHADDDDDDNDPRGDPKEAQEESEEESEEEKEREREEKDVEVVAPIRREGERSAARRRGRRSPNGPLGSRVLDDYGDEDNQSTIVAQLRRQTDSDSFFRSWEMHLMQERTQLEREKMCRKQEDRIREQEQREEENEEKRKQARLKLREQQKANKIEQDKLEHQKREARKASSEADKRRAWDGLKTKLFVHAGIYGGIALYHLWHSLLDSWRSTLDFSSTCTPSIPMFSEVCLPDFAAYLPLHVLLPVALCFLALAIQWGGLFLQIPSFVAFAALFLAIWSKVPSATDFAGLGVVVIAQLLVFACQRWMASVNERPPRRCIRVLGAVIEVSLFLINLGLALAFFSRRRDDVLYDSITDCFSTPSDFGSCYAYY